MLSDPLTKKYTGLIADQARKKLLTEGYNNLPSSKPKNFFSVVFRVVKEPMFILLLACGTVYMVMGDLQEGGLLPGFVFVIIGIELFQERKTAKALLSSITWFEIYKLIARHRYAPV